MDWWALGSVGNKVWVIPFPNNLLISRKNRLDFQEKLKKTKPLIMVRMRRMSSVRSETIVGL